MSNKRQDILQDDGQLRIFVVPVDIIDVPDLNIYEQMTYMILRSYVNPTDSTAFPSYSTIAKRGRMSRRSAIRAIEGLVQKGLLNKEIRLDVSKNRKIRNTSNLYTVNTPKPMENKEVVTDRHQGGECLTDTTPSVSQTPPLVTDRHHPWCPTDTLSKSFRTESFRTMIDRLIDSEVIAKFLKSKPENLKDEHIETIAEINQAYITHPGYTENLLIEKITACLKTYKRNFKGCLKKSIENELNKPVKPVKQRATKNKKPAIPIVQPTVEQNELTDEELQRIMAKARKLDEKFKS